MLTVKTPSTQACFPNVTLKLPEYFSYITFGVDRLTLEKT